MAFEVTDSGFHLGQKVAVVTNGERSSHPWFVRMTYVHRLGGDQFIRLYEVARLRSKEDDRIIPTDTVDAVYLNQEIGRTYIQIDQVTDKQLVPWDRGSAPAVGKWEAPEGSPLTREEMMEHFVSAAVAGQSLEPVLKEYHAEVEVLGAITVVIPVQAESKAEAMAIAKQKYETLAPHQYQQAVKDSLDSENVVQEFEPRDNPRVLAVCEPKPLPEILQDLDQIAKGEAHA